MNIQKLYSLVYKNKKKKKKVYIYPIKEHFASKLCPTIFNGIKITIQKSEQQNLKYPSALAEERNKNNTNGKIIIMIDEREREREREENTLTYSLL